MLSDYPNCCDSCRKEYKNQRLAELYKIISGDYSTGSSNFVNSPIAKLYNNTVKAGSNLTPIIPTRKRIILHPERQRLNQERTKKLAELARFVKGI